MKNTFLIFLTIAIFSGSQFLWASEKNECVPLTEEYVLLNAKNPVKDMGAPVKKEKVIKISKILGEPDQFLGKEVTVSGLIVDVCPKRGCWMKLASDKKFQTLRIKVQDGVMVFPLSARGRQAVVRGKMQGFRLPQKTAIKYFKHLAEEKGEAFDESTVTGPVNIYQIKPAGVSIR
ncbi:DUF4920 domain-containing protein [Candidatus Riflebacteria bacterium]